MARPSVMAKAEKPKGVQALRGRLVKTGWFHKPSVAAVRNFLQGREFALGMVICLVVALFLPDIWILAGVNDSIFIDTLLLLVLISFFVELALLSIVDVQYMFSFFQLMDVFGTLSMIFDISFLLGTPADEPLFASNNADSAQNLMLVKATRAAKVGARAGRLSRVLRFLRFLPFLAGGDAQDDNRTGIASMISGQLANLVATRVAGLTIILVIVIPFFDLLTFPQNDYSLNTWVERLSVQVAAGRGTELATELNMMREFYSKYEYGPFHACIGTPISEQSDGNTKYTGFICNNPDTSVGQAVTAWSSGRSAPPSQSSELYVHTDTFCVKFNMFYNNQVEAAFSMATMVFIIIIMVFCGLALSSVVTELAVRPLERMLGTVRTIAATVFKFSAEVTEEDDQEENVDIDSSNEMKLLEKVVQKLAIIADLQTAKNVPEATEGMGDEDIGILSMMKGTNIVEEKAKNDRRSMAVPRKKASTMNIRLEDFGVTQEVYNSWSFNALTCTKDQRKTITVFTISKFHEVGLGYINTTEEVQMLQRFVAAAEKEYLPVPFHSFSHAMDVTHACARMMRLINSSSFLSELEEFALLVASVGHDIGHPGVNNGFLSEVGHELALQYNDRSPLENMHCAKLYTITGKPESNVFYNLSKEQYKEVRKHCIETILHTDMMAHQGMVKDLQMIFQMNMEVFTELQDPDNAAMNQMRENAVYSEPDTKTKIMNMILHSADVSNPCRAWEVTHAWALVCLEEFFAQGDQEKMLGIPVQFLNNRDTLNKPNSQIGFIEFMIAPFFTAIVRLFPPMRESGDNLVNNLQQWEEMWENEASPSEEERAKVEARVGKVGASMEDAINRLPMA